MVEILQQQQQQQEKMTMPQNSFVSASPYPSASPSPSPLSFVTKGKREPENESKNEIDNDDNISLSQLHNHDCLLSILEFLSWHDLNTFAMTSRQCRDIRKHSTLDQTRCGIIRLIGEGDNGQNGENKQTKRGVCNAIELIDTARERQWNEIFSGNRTHLKLCGLTQLSSYIEPIDGDFINDRVCSLNHVTSLDCSSSRNGDDTCSTTTTTTTNNITRRPWFLPYEEYIDKGFAHGLAISLLVPNLRTIDMSYLPLTLLGVDWLLQNNSKLEIVRWDWSLIWPINRDVCDHIKSCKNLKEIYLNHTRMLFCWDEDGDNYGDNDNDDDDWDQEEFWTCLAENCQKLEKISIKGARCRYNKITTTSTSSLSSKTKRRTGGMMVPIPQEYLIKLVLSLPNLRWFCSDLTSENVVKLQKQRPNVIFC